MNQQRRLPPPPGVRPGAPAAAAQAAAPKTFSVVKGAVAGGQRILTYGPGGIGKSSLAALLPGAVVIDLEDGTRALDVARVGGVETFADLRAALLSEVLEPFQSVVIDTATRVEELAVAHTLATVPHEKGGVVSSIEGYGYGKGYQHVYDTFLLFLQDLDRLVRRGKNVCLIAHACTANVPNPAGNDWERFEPRLQAPPSGKASIRERVFEWSDHVLFIDYDVMVSKDGKGQGSGTRTIYPYELPTHRAKSRLIADAVPYEKGDAKVWNDIFGAQETK